MTRFPLRWVFAGCAALALAAGAIPGHGITLIADSRSTASAAARTSTTEEGAPDGGRMLSVTTAGVSLPPSTDWYMAGANPQRTSWVSEEVRGGLGVEWYRPIEPYIPYKVQPIATNGKIYISTAAGLYALNAATGEVEFVYPTEMPIGNSPTVVSVNGQLIAYFGGYDRRIHAVDADTGTPLAGFTSAVAGAGFETSPLIVNGTIYMGNRDGGFYALDAVTGALKWRYQSSAPILFSAAYKNNVVYFASIDSHAYALDASTGTPLWKSAQFHGTGFYTWWPVIYTDKSTGRDYVVFTNGENYSNKFFRLFNDHPTSETQLLFSGLAANTLIGPTTTTVPGDWVSGTTAINLAGWPNRYGALSYLEDRPNRHFVFVLDAATGQEFSFDSDGDGKKEYAPFLWSGTTHGGSKYPPVINGVDGVYYQQTPYVAADWISRGAIVGWKFGTPYVSRVARETYASDEPTVFSSGGRLIYTSLCCERSASSVDVTIPYDSSTEREWSYWSYNLFSQAPDFRLMYNDGVPANYTNNDGWQFYSGKDRSHNGVYSNHMVSQSPPIPYRGKLYFLKGNALIVYSRNPTRTALALATRPAKAEAAAPPAADQFRNRLEVELQKIMAAGPLRPGYQAIGLLDGGGFDETVSDGTSYGPLFEYFRNPADTVMTLLQALPYVGATTQEQIKQYVQTHYGPGRSYDVTRFTHVGYGNGASRDYALVPSDETPLGPALPAGSNLTYNFYAAWKYAQTFGDAKSLFDSMGPKVEAPPADLTVLIKKPYMLHRYLAGYLGYVELQKLAGYAPNPTVQNWFTTILNARINNFSKDTPYWGQGPCSGCGGVNYNRAFAVARNFMFLTPEVAELISRNLAFQIGLAVDEYQYVAPYWFVSRFDGATGEGAFQHLYDPPALLQAKAYILSQPYGELARFVDVPAFARGDLFYIQNLVAVLRVAGDGSTSGAPGRPTNVRLVP